MYELFLKLENENNLDVVLFCGIENNWYFISKSKRVKCDRTQDSDLWKSVGLWIYNESWQYNIHWKVLSKLFLTNSRTANKIMIKNFWRWEECLQSEWEGNLRKSIAFSIPNESWCCWSHWKILSKQLLTNPRRACYAAYQRMKLPEIRKCTMRDGVSGFVLTLP